MKSSRYPSGAGLMFGVLAPMLAIVTAVRITQSDGDFAAHLRMGNAILSSGAIPDHSLASYTAAADRMSGHAWLSEVLLAGLFRLGGLPLVVVVTAMIAAATHAAVGRWLIRRGVGPRWSLAAAMISFAVSVTYWLARPHMFSIAGVALTLFLLEGERRRLFLFAPLYAVWANLHGGWIYGTLMIACYVIGDLIESALSTTDRSNWLRQARYHSLALLLSIAATVLNPKGLGLVRDVVLTATDSYLASHMAEFLPPDFQALSAFPFLVALLIAIALIAKRGRTIPSPQLLFFLVSTALALRSYRNIALFGVSAWPLVALYARPRVPERWKITFLIHFSQLDPVASSGVIGIPVTVLLLALGLSHGRVGPVQLIPDDFSPTAFPVEAVSKARAAVPASRVFEDWAWAGYIMYAWPEAAVHVDPLKFNRETMKSYSIIQSVAPGWRNELSRWRINTVIVSPWSRLAYALGENPGWSLLYRDSTAVVFRDSGPPAVNAQ